MNNFRLLNIINPQIIYSNNCGQEENDGKYMVIIPAFLGYDKNAACAIYLTISEKLLDESTNDKLELLINEIQEDLSVLLRGYDDFVPGVDYYLSESLYEYVKVAPQDDSSDMPEPPTPPDDPVLCRDYCYDLSGIVVLHGRTVNRLLNINKYNIKRVYEILALDEWESKNRRRTLTMTRPDISAYLTEEDIDRIDIDLAEKIVMKDYVIYDTQLNFTQDTESYKYLFDINNKDMRNLEWFFKFNNMANYEYSSDELLNITQTFFKIILNNAFVQNPESLNNQIYEKVIKYYANGAWDDAIINLNLLFNSTVSTTLPQSKISCGCNNNINDIDGSSITNCVELYKTSMEEWLKKMLADTDFYKDWFFITVTGSCPEPNISMIDSLIKLLEEYISINFSGNFNPDKKYDIYNHMNCCNECSKDDAYKNIILHYIEVLNAVKNNDIDVNKNKINIYGQEFAEILPILDFLGYM